MAFSSEQTEQIENAVKESLRKKFQIGRLSQNICLSTTAAGKGSDGSFLVHSFAEHNLWNVNL